MHVSSPKEKGSSCSFMKQSDDKIVKPYIKMPLDIGTVTGIYTFFKQRPHHDENEQIKEMWRIIEHFLDSMTWKVMMI